MGLRPPRPLFDRDRRIVLLVVEGGGVCRLAPKFKFRGPVCDSDSNAQEATQSAAELIVTAPQRLRSAAPHMVSETPRMRSAGMTAHETTGLTWRAGRE